VVLGGDVPFVGPQENYAAQGYTQGNYFEPRAGGEVRIFGFYNNKPKKKKNKARGGTFRSIWGWGVGP